MAISFVNASAQVAANSSPQTVTLPAGIQAGDWLFIVVIQASASAITFSASGYSSIARNSNATRSMTIEVLGKVATSSESNPSVTCSSATAGWAVQMVAYRGVNRATAEDAADVSSDAAAAMTWQPTGITTVTDNAWVISFVGSKDDNALNYSVQNSFNDRMSGANYDATTGNGSDYSVGWADKLIASHGAATMPTWNQSANGTDAWVGLSLALLPASDQTATPGVLSLTTTKFAPVIKLAVIPPVNALALSTFAPVLKLAVIPPVKTLSLSTFAPVVNIGVKSTPDTKALSLSTFAPTVLTPQVVTPGTKALVLTSFVPVVSTPRLVVPPKTSLVLTLFAPDVAVGGGGSPVTVTPNKLSLSLQGYAPDVTVVGPSPFVPIGSGGGVGGYGMKGRRPAKAKSKVSDDEALAVLFAVLDDLE